MDRSHDGEPRAAQHRAERIRLFALASALPPARADELMLAVAGPCGPGSTSILTVNEMSTSITLDGDGHPDVELPNVAAAFRYLLDHEGQAGVLLRTFTDTVAFTGPSGRPIPLKELRGWLMRDRRLLPLPAAEVFAAHCTDADTGEPLPPERGVAYRDAWPVAVRPASD
jgi:hypothetical protein